MTRYDIVRKLITDCGAKSVAEVGVYAGRLSFELLKLPQIETYYMIDPWGAHLNQQRAAAMRVANADSRVKIIERRSVDAATMFSDQELDFVYLDPMHDLESARADLEAWWRVTKIGLAGHDYALYNSCAGCPCGVVPAVEEFALKTGLEVKIDGRSMNYAERLVAAYEPLTMKIQNAEAYSSWSIER